MGAKKKAQPVFVGTEIQRCPVCGAVLRGLGSYSFSGHVRGIEVGPTTFGTCQEHREEAEGMLARDDDHESQGYCGEWEPRLGLVAMIETTDDEIGKRVTLIDGHDFDD